MIRKVEMERFTVISARPFDEVVAAIKASIGNPNMAEFVKSTQEAKSATDLDTAIQPVLGRTGLMLFVEFDQGMIVRKGTERRTSRIIRIVIGNPLNQRTGQSDSRVGHLFGEAFAGLQKFGCFLFHHIDERYGNSEPPVNSEMTFSARNVSEEQTRRGQAQAEARKVQNSRLAPRNTTEPHHVPWPVLQLRQRQ